MEHHSYHYTTNSAKINYIQLVFFPKSYHHLFVGRLASISSSCPSPHLPKEHKCVTTESDIWRQSGNCNNSQLCTLDNSLIKGADNLQTCPPNCTGIEPKYLFCVPLLSPALGLFSYINGTIKAACVLA